MIEVNKTNIKSIWQILKKILGKMTLKTSFRQTFLINNKQISNKAEIAQFFILIFSILVNLQARI